MTQTNHPKRQHWWPLVQSKHWVNERGQIHACRKDGTFFSSNPLNLAVESELYTFLESNGSKNAELELWLSREIDDPLEAALAFVSDKGRIERRRIISHDPQKAELCKKLGYRITPYVEFLTITNDVRHTLARYIAAQLVRTPHYLEKLIDFQVRENEIGDKNDAKKYALNNLKTLFELYADRIFHADLMLLGRDGNFEFLFADGGLQVAEPWRSQSGIPFDIHAPLTPDLTLQVLPVRDPVFGNQLPLSFATDAGVSRMNRIVVGAARRFVFSRGAPPANFVAKNFGVPAPKNIGYRYVNGELETIYDPTRGE